MLKKVLKVAATLGDARLEPLRPAGDRFATDLGAHMFLEQTTHLDP